MKIFQLKNQVVSTANILLDYDSLSVLNYIRKVISVFSLFLRHRLGNYIHRTVSIWLAFFHIARSRNEPRYKKNQFRTTFSAAPAQNIVLRTEKNSKQTGMLEETVCKTVKISLGRMNICSRSLTRNGLHLGKITTALLHLRLQM